MSFLHIIRGHLSSFIPQSLFLFNLIALLLFMLMSPLLNFIQDFNVVCQLNLWYSVKTCVCFNSFFLFSLTVFCFYYDTKEKSTTIGIVYLRLLIKLSVYIQLLYLSVL